MTVSSSNSSLNISEPRFGVLKKTLVTIDSRDRITSGGPSKYTVKLTRSFERVKKITLQTTEFPLGRSNLLMAIDEIGIEVFPQRFNGFISNTKVYETPVTLTKLTISLRDERGLVDFMPYCEHSFTLEITEEL